MEGDSSCFEHGITVFKQINLRVERERRMILILNVVYDLKYHSFQTFLYKSVLKHYGNEQIRSLKSRV